MIRDLRCTEYQAAIGLSVYALGFGLIPLVTASFSEEFGRQPLYIGSGLGFLLMSPMIALYVELRLIILVVSLLILTVPPKVEKYPNGYCSTFHPRGVWVYGGDYGWRNNL